MAKQYQIILNNEIKRRKRINQNFSLRSMARLLKVSPGFLSGVLSGKKKLSLARAKQFAQILGYSKEQSQEFCQLVAGSRLIKTPDKTKKILKKQQVSLDTFELIADWFHFALLEIVRTGKYKPDGLRAARRLGISISEAAQALERLERLGLIRLQGGYYIRTSQLVKTGDGSTNRALQYFHGQMIEKAQQSFENQSFDDRDITSRTMAIDPKNIEQAKKEITKFRKRMAKLCTDGKLTDVFQLNIQFFKLTREEKK